MVALKTTPEKVSILAIQIANRLELRVPVVSLAIPHPASLLCIALIPPLIQVAYRLQVLLKGVVLNGIRIQEVRSRFSGFGSSSKCKTSLLAVIDQPGLRGCESGQRVRILQGAQIGRAAVTIDPDRKDVRYRCARLTFSDLVFDFQSGTVRAPANVLSMRLKANVDQAGFPRSRTCEPDDHCQGI